MKSIKPTSGKAELEAKTKHFNDGESATAIIVYTDDHSKLKSKGTYNASKPNLESHDYRIPELYKRIEETVQGDKVTFKWDIKWNQFNKPLSSPGDSDYNPKGLSSNHCEIYSVLRAEYRYLEDGYTKLPSKYDAVHGIDGLFQKGDEYLVVESKFVKPEKYHNYCNGKSPLPHLGWKKDEKATLDPENDPDVEVYMRQMSWRWVTSSFSKMMKNGRSSQTKNVGMKMSRIDEKRINRALNVFGARPVYPPPGSYGFKVRASEYTKISKDIKKMASSTDSLEIDWHPDWLISGKPYNKVEFWAVTEDGTHIYAKREEN